MMVRRVISGLMLAVLLLAGQALAVARGEAPAAMQMVLCTGFGTQVVHVDAEGNPVSAPHLCPDGLTAMVEAHVPPPAVVPVARALGPVEPAAAPVAVARLARAVFEARGPPLA
ncbi:hypothetical protein [Vannielia litorea]|uniref:hypothetical protein n=1 Tax=Vannielia litorea TaxID=1217970 RepID=UPI001C9447AB|nr:hypothetical protein [Vannielia litorea]MBY6048036.1 hypothetical protein [Vannielia litorea]MBY6075450.1 hypothetical protein [Vannielia litorea]